MSPRMRFVGGPADGDVLEQDEIKSNVTHLIYEKNPAPADAYYERSGRDDDGTWVMAWKPEGFDDETT